MALSSRDYERCVQMIIKYADKLTNGSYPCAVVYATRSGALKQAGSKVLGELIRRNADEFIQDEDWMEDDRCTRGTVLPKLEGPVESLPLHRLRSMIPVLLSAELGNKRPIYEASFRPDWWPVEIPFVNVRQKPDSVESGSEWRRMLVHVVESCYQHFAAKGLEEIETDNEEEEGEEDMQPNSPQMSRPAALQTRPPNSPQMSRPAALQTRPPNSPQMSCSAALQTRPPNSPQMSRPAALQTRPPNSPQMSRPAALQTRPPNSPQMSCSAALQTRPPNSPQMSRPAALQTRPPNSPQMSCSAALQTTPKNMGCRYRHSTPMHRIPLFENTDDSVDQCSPIQAGRRQPSLEPASPRPAKRFRKPKQIFTPS